MRINTRVVYDLKTDKVIEREGYEYHGPLALAVTGSTPVLQASFETRGGRLEIYTATVDHGAVAAAAEEIETFAVSGARAGDVVFINVQDPVVNLVPVGAKVTATDVVSLWVISNYGVTTATATGTITVDIMILKQAHN